MLVNLDERDWAEIYYAIETKMLVIQEGRYHDAADAHDMQDAREWMEHLQYIQSKIGIDGEIAFEKSNGRG